MTKFPTMEDLNTLIATIDTLTDKEQRAVAYHLLARWRDLVSAIQRGIDPAREEAAKARWTRLAKEIKTITGEDITQRSRSRAVVEPRWCALAMMRKDGYTWMEIERASGWHHSTLISARDRVDDALAYPKMYPDFVRTYKAIAAV